MRRRAFARLRRTRLSCELTRVAYFHVEITALPVVYQHQRYRMQTIRMSMTFVFVGPVLSKSPSGSKKW